MHRQHRLHVSADFERVRKQGRTWRHPLVTMGVAPNDLTHNRVGFIVSKKLGSAVVRNRVRRLLREAVRTALPHLKPGMDIVLVARNEIVGQPYSMVKTTLRELCTRARLWREEPDP